MTTLSLQHRRQLSDTLPAVGLAALLLMTGNWIAKAPMKAWFVVVAAMGLPLLRVDTVYWMAGAVLMATMSRLLASMSGAHFLNFVHYPLVLGGLVVALAKGPYSSLARPLGLGL